ncbi:MAG: TolC family outer membrane protein [Pseudomonadota bacterium]
MAITRTRPQSACYAGVVFLLAVFLPPSRPAYPETLRQALQSAYLKNPKLDAERSHLRATDEQMPQALSDARPSVTFSADASVRHQNDRTDDTSALTSSENTTFPTGYSLSLNQNIFHGFRIRHAVNAAEANIQAGRAILRATEQTVFLDAVTTFMDVIHDTKVIKLRENNVLALSQYLQGTRERLAVSEATRTDLAQSRTRLAQAVYELELARANLKASRARYQRVIKHAPNRLVVPNLPAPLLPVSLSKANAYAERESPSVLAAIYKEQAAHFKIKEISSELLPTLQLGASYANSNDSYQETIDLQQGTGVITGTLAVPLYQRGLISSRVRQAKHLHMRALKLVEEARDEAREAAHTAWTRLQASRAQMRTAKLQVQSSRVALSGVREEKKAGRRTLLDVLNAEQEFVNAQVLHAASRRDLIVSAYTLLSAIGRLTAQHLGLRVKIDNPKAHADAIRQKWYGLSITHADGRREDVRAGLEDVKEQ